MSEYLPDDSYTSRWLVQLGGAALWLTYFNSRLHFYRPPHGMDRLDHIDVLEPRVRLFGCEQDMVALQAMDWPILHDWYPTDEVFRDYERYQCERLDKELGEL